jgi:hypothetical protein
MSTVEIRVRPVIRHIVTRYTPSQPLPSVVAGIERRTDAMLETLGEFDNEDQAEMVAAALRAKATQHAYAIVQETMGEIGAHVYYAYDEAEAAQRKADLEADGTQTYRIYSRPNRA